MWRLLTNSLIITSVFIAECKSGSVIFISRRHLLRNLILVDPSILTIFFFLTSVGFRSFWMLVLLVILTLILLIISWLHHEIPLMIVKSTWLLLLLLRRWNIKRLTARCCIVIVNTLILLTHQLVSEASLIVNVSRTWRSNSYWRLMLLLHKILVLLFIFVSISHFFTRVGVLSVGRDRPSSQRCTLATINASSHLGIIELRIVILLILLWWGSISFLTLLINDFWIVFSFIEDLWLNSMSLTRWRLKRLILLFSSVHRILIVLEFLHPLLFKVHSLVVFNLGLNCGFDLAELLG